MPEPAQPKPFTLEQILAATRATVPCPTRGEGGITVRRISSAEYLRCYPPPLESVKDEPAEAKAAREPEWTKLHADALEEVPFRLGALAAGPPVLTPEAARG